MNINYVLLVGRVAATPQLKSFTKGDNAEGARVYFPLAIDRSFDRGKKENKRTNFIDIVGWGDSAKRHAQYLTKGTEVTVVGELISENRYDEAGKFVKKDVYVQIREVQYGRKPAKDMAPVHATPDADRARIEALEAQIAAIAAGHPLAAPAPAPVPAPVDSTDPFAE